MYPLRTPTLPAPLRACAPALASAAARAAWTVAEARLRLSCLPLALGASVRNVDCYNLLPAGRPYALPSTATNLLLASRKPYLRPPPRTLTSKCYAGMLVRADVKGESTLRRSNSRSEQREHDGPLKVRLPEQFVVLLALLWCRPAAPARSQPVVARVARSCSLTGRCCSCGALLLALLFAEEYVGLSRAGARGVQVPEGLGGTPGGTNPGRRRPRFGSAPGMTERVTPRLARVALLVLGCCCLLLFAAVWRRLLFENGSKKQLLRPERST